VINGKQKQFNYNAAMIHELSAMNYQPWTAKFPYLYAAKRSIAASLFGGGKSGQHRASCFL